MSPRILIGIAKVNTSVSADSMISVVEVLALIDIFFTNPTTTAEDVPPKAEPINRQVRFGKLKISLQRANVTIQVTKKPTAVIPADS